MNLAGYLDFLKKLISFIPFNIFDLILILLFAVYVFEDASFGLIPALIGFVSTIASFFLGLSLYLPLSKLLVKEFSLTKGISDAIAFFLVTVIAFTVVSYILSFIRRKYFHFFIPKFINAIGGAVFGSLSFFFISSFIVALLLSFPVSNPVKSSVKNSITGKFLSSQVQRFDGEVRRIFGGAIEESINFLTVEPESNQSVVLNFKTTSFREDNASAQEMLTLINLERKKAGLNALVLNERLTRVAQDHGKDMLRRGYFSHYTPEGLSPFDRMAAANISYQFAGENLAFAPDVTIAMDGLMKSPGHRANILSANFNRVGIGVLDAGVYGEMFVQDFTN